MNREHMSFTVQSPIRPSVSRIACLAALTVACATAFACGDSDDADSDSGVDAAQDTSDDTASDVTSDVAADAMADVATDVGTDTTPTGPNPDDYPADPESLADLGGDRPAAAHIPSDYAVDRYYPLVVLLHGFGANGTAQDFIFQLEGRVDERDMIMVVPEGTTNANGQQFWNATDTCCGFGSGVDDSGYLRALLEETMERYPIDPSRVILFGHSNGAYMSFRMACEHSDLVTGIMGLAGLEWEDESRCEPSQPVSIVHVHGTVDTTIPYERSQMGPGAVVTTERWAARNDCDVPYTRLSAIDLERNVAGDETTQDIYDGCADNSVVELWTMDGAGHVPIFNTDFTDLALDTLFEHARPASE